MPGHASSNRLTSASLIDPKTLMSIRNLELRARVVVEGFWSGIHRSPYHGFSAEFTEYRQYTPDDDPRYLDWRVFARSDRFFIKKFEDETNLRCHVLADRSRSMAFGSLGYNKEQYASTLAATLAYFLHLQGDSIGLMTFDEQVREYLPPRHRTSHLRQVMLALEKPAAGRATDFGAPLKRILELARKRGLIILISDFLAPLDLLDQNLGALAACGHELLVLQVLDPAELNFDFKHPAMFEDVESGRVLFIDPGAARKEYQLKLTAHRDALRAMCQRLGVAYQELVTNRALELSLFDFLRERMARRKSFQRFSRVHHARERAVV